jgi:protein-L-isoaspartate O-methyltransferase
MDRDAELEIIRRAYAKQVMAAAGVVDRRIEAAFAAVKREDFLGRGPWQIVRWGRGYVPTPTRNPAYLYDDVVVAVVSERNLNNGQPSFLAALIAGAAPRPGEHAVHIGAGVGYYTAILARLVGRGGRITAIELDPALADRLATNLAGQANVRVVQGDGARVGFAPADVILVNAGATRPAAAWLDGLAEGRRAADPAADRGRLPKRRRAAWRGVPHHPAGRRLSRETDLGRGDFPLRGHARRRNRSSACRGIRQGPGRRGDPAVPPRRRAGGGLLGEGSRLVPGLCLTRCAAGPA